MFSRNIIFSGGLGNQMFQYALLLSLRHRGYEARVDATYYGFVKMHNGYELERVFGIKENIITTNGPRLFLLRLLDRLTPPFLYMNEKGTFRKDVLLRPACFIRGTWNNLEYFQDIEKEVKIKFRFKNIDNKNLEISNKMHEQESVSLHLRRGDYAAFGMKLIGDDYYIKAVSYISSKIKNPIYYIFSDDEIEVKRLAEKLHIHYILVDCNQNEYSYRDMFLMTQCKHNIIANSTFSWWGAWLNDNPGKIVVAPEKWSNNPNETPQKVKNWVLL